MSGPGEEYAELRAFLDTLDPVLTWKTRPETLQATLDTLIKASIFCKEQLVGITIEEAFEIQPKGGKLGLLKKAFSAQNLETAQAAVPKGDSQSEILKALVLSVDKQSTGIEQRCLASLAQALKVQDETVYVSMADKLAGINLAGLHQECLPDGQLVNSVATEAARLVKKGVKVPFVAVDLFKCQPHWSNVHTGQDDGDKGRASKRMPILQWQMAFDRGALASAVCNQWSYASAIAHKNNCLKIAVRAELTSPPRRHWLAVIYDRLARREWQELAFHNSVDFKVNEVSLREDPCILKSAEAEFDRIMAEDKKAPVGKDSSSSNGWKDYGASKTSWNSDRWGSARRASGKGSGKGYGRKDSHDERPSKRSRHHE